jgi:hypothetical protein
MQGNTLNIAGHPITLAGYPHLRCPGSPAQRALEGSSGSQIERPHMPLSGALT